MILNNILRLAVVLTLLISSVAASYGRDYTVAVRRIVDRYPEATLQDVYKSFFQDRFGPGHLVTDTVAARKYLFSELEEMDGCDIPYYEPTGCGDNYYRVSLAVVRDGIIDKDSFFEIFLKSASSVKMPELETWRREWHDILSCIERDGIEFDNYEADRNYIDRLLDSGDYVVHHSKRFEQVYKPHYRIISKDVVDTTLLKNYRDE